jgi:hypothetical protein
MEAAESSLADLVGVVASIAAAVIAYLALRQTNIVVNFQKDARKHADARRVAAWLVEEPENSNQYLVKVRNVGDTPVYDCVAVVAFNEEDQDEIPFGVLPPQEEPFRERLSRKPAWVGVRFTDPVGTTWWRNGDGFLDTLEERRGEGVRKVAPFKKDNSAVDETRNSESDRE